MSAKLHTHVWTSLSLNPVMSSSEAGTSPGSETQDLLVRMGSKVSVIPRSLCLCTERTEGATEGG